MPTLLALISGGYDLLIILLIALVLFGNRLPTMMRALEQSGFESRCLHCGRPSLSAHRCPHCGRLKSPRIVSRTPSEPRDEVGRVGASVPFPRWLVGLLVTSGIAWAGDWIGIAAAELPSDVIWHSWWHWATLSLIGAALTSLAAFTVFAQFGDQNDRTHES
jgi:hypothetical protein